MTKYSCKKEQNKFSGYTSFSAVDGFTVKPKNKVKYEGIQVSSLTLIQPNLIQTIIIKKIDRRLGKYLYLLTEEDDGEEFILEDLYKYKKYIIDKYAKYLTPNQIKEILLKVKFTEAAFEEKINSYYITNSKGRGR